MTIGRTCVHKLGKGKEIRPGKLNLQFCYTIKFYPLAIMKQFGYRNFLVNQEEKSEGVFFLTLVFSFTRL